jgi:tRNA threonylcarbamoyladenosine biosynthesis protein TsaB
LRLLAIETATAACSVALFDGDRLVAHAHEVVGRGHAERLIPMIAALPDRGRADRILVDCGPGSFTGVRVGLAAARALGLAWRVPVAGFSSTALVAAATLERGEAPATLAVVLQGGHGEYFVQRFAGKPMRALSDLLSAPPEAARAACADAVLVGSGARDLAGDEGRDALPDARWVTALPDAFADLPARPIYGRAPDARLPGS